MLSSGPWLRKPGGLEHSRDLDGCFYSLSKPSEFPLYMVALPLHWGRLWRSHFHKTTGAVPTSSPGCQVDKSQHNLTEDLLCLMKEEGDWA